MNTSILNTNGVPLAEQLFGWWNVNIESVNERLSENSRLNKLLVRFIINDEAAKRKVIYGHICTALKSFITQPAKTASICSIRK